MNNLALDIESRDTPFGESCRAFDEGLIEQYFPVYHKLRINKRSAEFIADHLRMLTAGQLTTMATAFEAKYGSKVKHEVPLQWDDIHIQVPVDLEGKSGQFGVARIRCESCKEFFTLMKNQWYSFEQGELDQLLCKECVEEKRR